MQWTTQQAAALDAVAAWLKDKNGPQTFRLFGYAGTGKTTLAKHLANQAKGAVLFACFTGKAALVLRSKGCTGASTIHSLIYKPFEDEDGEIVFKRNPDSAAATAELIVVDEVSMVDEELGEDLLSYGTKVLVLGDPEQLPPINGTGFFMAPNPDIMLTEIRRQEQDNPIIYLSMRARQGEAIIHGDYGDSRVIKRNQLGQKMVLGADQVLVGKNDTRRTINNRIRGLLGHLNPYPEKGDRLVCLRNNTEKNLLNGGLWTAKTEATIIRDKADLMVESIDDDSITNAVNISVPINFFHGTEKELPYSVRRHNDEFDYGYALTVHKAQGSQWDNIILFDESRTFREMSSRWLYTGITRAAERLTIVI